MATGIWSTKPHGKVKLGNPAKFATIKKSSTNVYSTCLASLRKGAIHSPLGVKIIS